MTEELKPCPFCHSKSQLPSAGQLIRPGIGLVDSWNVECFECKIEMDEFSSREQAIEAWNKRV